jgi:uncharacterized protein (DUF488 family)
MTPKIAFTIGYEGVDVDDMARAAKAAGVTTVVDTRRNPTSRRPAFRREALRASLLRHGVGYESRPALGVPARIRPLARTRPWMFRAAYRGVLGRADIAGELDATLATMRDETVALLCFEAEPGQCHRTLLADALTARAPFSFVDLHVRRV